MQTMLAGVLEKTTLDDLLLDEQTMNQRIDDLATQAEPANGRAVWTRT